MLPLFPRRKDIMMDGGGGMFWHSPIGEDNIRTNTFFLEELEEHTNVDMQV